MRLINEYILQFTVKKKEEKRIVLYIYTNKLYFSKKGRLKIF